MVPTELSMATASIGADLPVLMQPAFERVQSHGPDLTALGTVKSAISSAGWGSNDPSGYTPAQMIQAYGLNSIGNGTGQTIAVVDAYDDPALLDSTRPGFLGSDLAKFDQMFGLQNPPSFFKINEYGSMTNLPGPDPAGAGNPQGNWEVEEALDVEWVHALAPGANIVLIECASASSVDMFQGVMTAARLSGVSVVSMSWGSSEFSGETSYDTDFTTPVGHEGVTFVASTGDQGSPGEYPAYSPNVLAVGGTSLYLSANGFYGSETAWSDSGGGISAFETKPDYQAAITGTLRRSIPDVSSDANPDTGVAVFDSYNNTSETPWEQVGGTSFSAPIWASLIAIANQERAAVGNTTLNGESQTLPAIYSISTADYHDITSGSNGGFSAALGYDEVTGLGSPEANVLVNDLGTYGSTNKLVVSTEPPAIVKAGSGLGFSVAFENAAGMIEQGWSGSITVSLGNNPTGDALSGTLTVMAQNGIANFAGLTLKVAGRGYTLQAAYAQSVAITNPVMVTPAAANRLAILSEPTARIGVNQPFGVSVAVVDQFGNLENSYSGSVKLSRASGPGGGRLGGILTLQAQNGVAAFGGLTLNRVGLGYSIKVVSQAAITSTRTTFFGIVSNAQTNARASSRGAVIKLTVKHHRPEEFLVRHV